MNQTGTDNKTILKHLSHTSVCPVPFRTLERGLPTHLRGLRQLDGGAQPPAGRPLPPAPPRRQQHRPLHAHGARGRQHAGGGARGRARRRDGVRQRVAGHRGELEGEVAV